MPRCGAGTSSASQDYMQMRGDTRPPARQQQWEQQHDGYYLIIMFCFNLLTFVDPTTRPSGIHSMEFFCHVSLLILMYTSPLFVIVLINICVSYDLITVMQSTMHK
jgi:hypothetical protein